MDHFGDETEEEKKAAEERETTKKDTKKPKEISLEKLLECQSVALLLLLKLSFCLKEIIDLKRAPAADDDDDMDHFGDETEEEKKAAEEREAAKKDTKKPKEKKLVPVGYGVKKLMIMLT
ncbi:hypothetical protein F2Q68_00043548 [Brassica cretica]|uniref:Uncharacterized protein n=1 Tax=Brassica cretica TaxID=69181 RepID=A0A8S9LGB4_BRACR|nr:hypothetical protein F2Q68_00043548 [Brassica cretica]